MVQGSEVRAEQWRNIDGHRLSPGGGKQQADTEV